MAGANLDGGKTVGDVLTLEQAPHVEVRGLEIRWFMDTGLRIVESPGDGFERNVCKAVVTLNRERFFSLREWREATGKDLHSIFAHPRYADPENRDFRLLPDSPNIGAGKDGATIGAMGIREDQP